MSTISAANLQEYWSTMHSNKISFFPDTFYKKIQLNILAVALGKHLISQIMILEPVRRVSNFLEYINTKFLEHFTVEENIYVDVVKFEVKIQNMFYYNSNKSTKWGIHFGRFGNRVCL